MSFVAHEDHATTHDFFSNNDNSNSNDIGGPNTDFHNILSSHNSHTKLLDENHDILDEFLDQRVYDSMGTTTPTNADKSNNNNNSNSNSNSRIKQEQDQQQQQLTRDTLMNSLYALTNEDTTKLESNNLENGLNGDAFSQFTGLPDSNNNNLDLSLDGVSPQDNEYLYMGLPHDSNFSHDQLLSKPSALQNHQNSITNSIYNTPSAITSPLDDRSVSISNGYSHTLNHNHTHIVQSNPTSLSEYEFVREELNKLKFGCHRINAVPKTVDVPDPSYLDFSSEAMNKLPHKMTLSALPSHSRVETQIRCDIALNPAPSQALLYVPQDLISKNKFCLSDPVENLHPRLKENLLYLDAYVLTSDLQKSCNICTRCIKREQKRASRGKAAGEMDEFNTTAPTPTPAPSSSSSGKTPAAIKNNSTSWADENMMKKAIIFNCKEIVSFPSPSGLNNNNSKSIELSARIICYCRHHKEQTGFRVLMLIKNNKGEVVAKQLSSPIMIMDRKKNIPLTKDSMPNSVAGSSLNLQGMEETSSISSKKKRISNSDSENEQRVSNNEYTQHSSPNSVDESASEVHTNTDAESSRGIKRKKLSVDDSYNASANPMYNGSINGYSPLSNSDTNTSTNIHFMKQPSFAGLSPMGTQHPPPNPQFQQMQTPQAQPSSQQTMQRLPSIQRIIPAQGPVRGGIEITLLGFNFRPGLSVKFGSNQALATHCWSETTIVTYLPPASHPGQVLVSFENEESAIIGGPPQHQIFTYTDDTDRQLIELALQIVGLKMNGKLEDAKNIAKRIVGSDGSAGGNSNGSAPTSMTTTPSNLSQSPESGVHDWFNSAHASLKKLTSSGLSTQVVLVRLLSLVDLPNCPIIIPNWQLANAQGQTLLHLATMKNYHKLIKFLVTHGCKIDIKDNQGLTPLFLASMCGHRKLIELFIECKSNWNLKLSNDKHLRDYCDLNVIDMFNTMEQSQQQQQQQQQQLSSEEEDGSSVIKKATSFDSLDSMLNDNYGRHVSKMSHDDEAGRDLPSQDQQDSGISTWEDNRNYSSEFADSEFESEDDYDEEEADYCDDEYSDGDDLEVSDGEETEEHSNSDSAEQSTDATSESSKPPSSPGLWQKVKNVFNNDDSDLPQYDDLFPFGPSSTFTAKPKSAIEQSMNNATTESQSVEAGSSSSVKSELEPTSSKITDTDLDAGLASDSSEDMVVTYINHPRKPVEHDKMLVFFWIPALVVIFALFFMVYVVGYDFKQLDHAKELVRNAVGNLMLGNERIAKVFKSTGGAKVAAAGSTATTAIRRIVEY
ncbi:SPT23 [Candida metapsilosis]|uniref:SPT23 n=1 Tax=Candida metapsilosis TaxID=273372 RepID=A0A8H8DBV0_9ASCO|nr:SPT23 [Candida metapsilosis]